MDAASYLKTIKRCASYLQGQTRFAPKIAVIMGSGLGQAVPRLDDQRVVPYERIPGFPRPTVKGHAGRMILGRLGGRSIAVLQGRFHYYEGHPMEAITLPIRALSALGLETLVITAAVGSMHSRLKPGHLCAVTDHINFIPANPLRGFHQQPFGEMFPDLIDAYDPGLRRLALQVCRKVGVPASQGVYVAASGPSYETPAEIRAYKMMGADVVGMSVAPEVIVARQMGVRVLALSWVANWAAGLTKDALSHTDVLAMGKKVSARLRLVLEELLQRV